MVEYPFKDLLPLDEVLEREGYYKDWTHIDADTFHQISELVKFIREKGYGADTREAIAQALERVYYDAMKSGNADMELSMARKHFKDLASRLDASDDKLTSTTAQLAQTEREKISHGDVSVYDIDKNKGKLDQTFMSDELLQQMAGDTPVNATPANGSVTLSQTAFSGVIGKNVFDKTSAVLGRVDATNGNIFLAQDFYTSDFISVNPGDVLTFSNNVSHYGFYNADESFKEGKSGGMSITYLEVPEGVYKAKVSFYYTHIDYFMVTKNEPLPDTYEPFQLGINKKYVPKPTEEIENLLLEPSNKNLFDKSKATVGFYLEASGNLSPNTSLSTSDYIAVKPGDIITMTQMRTLAFADSNKTNKEEFYKSDNSYPEPYTIEVPNGVSFMRVSYRTEVVDRFQVEVGSEQTSYTPYAHQYIKKSLIPPMEFTKDTKEEVIINLPKEIMTAQGTEANIYFNNIIEGDYTNYQIDVTTDKGEQLSDKWTSSSISTGDTSLKIDLYENYTKKVATAETRLVIKPSSVGSGVSKSLLLIGDSTVRTDGTGAVTQRLLDKFSNDVMDITLQGSMGSVPNLYEGRGGWTAGMYRQGITYNGKTNPFYNPTKGDFDFDFYMTNQGYTDVDYVVLNLGINDTFWPISDSELNGAITSALISYDYIINDIKDFGSDIKIGINVTIPPNDSQDVFGRAYGTGQTQWRYKRNNILWVDQLMKHYEDVPNVYLVPIHLNIDTKNNIADGVHPTLDGYNQIGDVMYAWVKSFEN